MSQAEIKHDPQAWHEGFTAGAAGKPGVYTPYPAGTTQAWSWRSGWIEGDAKRQGYSYSPCLCEACRGGQSEPRATTAERLFQTLVEGKQRSSFHNWTQRGIDALNDPDAEFPALW